MDGDTASPDTPDLRRVEADIEALAARYVNASGVLMTAVLALGARAETLLDRLPEAARDAIDAATLAALDRAYRAAATASALPAVPRAGPWAHRAAVLVSGAGGGFAGLGSALIELPVTVATMFAAIQKVARENGFDPRDEAVRLECLRVFGSGSPLPEDDGVDASFLTSRVMVNGATVQAALRAVAPAFAARIGQKLAAQTVPVLGSVAGAAINVAFLDYYLDMARVRFGLMRLARDAAEADPADRFRRAVARRRDRGPR
jgi:hypothetical protein